MSQIFTDVGACGRTRIARITRMQHKKKICENPWNLWDNILKQNLWESVKSVGDMRKGESIKTCKKRALSEFFVLPLYLQLQLETIKIK